MIVSECVCLKSSHSVFILALFLMTLCNRDEVLRFSYSTSMHDMRIRLNGMAGSRRDVCRCTEVKRELLYYSRRAAYSPCAGRPISLFKFVRFTYNYKRYRLVCVTLVYSIPNRNTIGFTETLLLCPLVCVRTA